jgi:hypothetical protein
MPDHSLDYAAPSPPVSVAPSRRFGVVALSLLGIILLVAVGLRVYRIGIPSFWLDEFYSIDVASGRGYWMTKLPQNQLVRFSEIPSQGTVHDVMASLAGGNHPPLYYLTLHAWMLKLGEGDSAVRALSAVFSILAILFLFDTARTLHGTATALWASAIMAVAASQIYFAQDARSYTMLLAFCMAACAAIVRLERFGPNRLREVALIAGTLAMLLTHYMAFSMLGALLLYTVIRLRGSSLRYALFGLLFATAIFVAAWGPTMWYQRGNFSGALAWQASPDGPNNAWATLVRASWLPVRYFLKPTTASQATACLAATFYIVPLLMLRRRPELLLWWILLVVGVGTLAIGDIHRGTESLHYMRYSLPEAAAVFVLATTVCATNKYLRHLVPAALVLGCIGALPEDYIRWKPDLRSYAGDIDRRLAPTEPIIFFRADINDCNDAPLCLSLRHYSKIDRQVMFVPGPVSQGVVHQLVPNTTAWYVASGERAAIDASKLLPGCHISAQDQIEPFALCTRLVLPQADAALHTHPGRGPS